MLIYGTFVNVYIDVLLHTYIVKCNVELFILLCQILKNISCRPMFMYSMFGRAVAQSHVTMSSFLQSSYNPSGWCLAYLRLSQTQTLMVTISVTVWNKQDKQVLARCGCQFQLTERRKTTHRLPMMSGPTCLYGNRYMQHPGGLGKHVLFHVDFMAI